MKVQAPDFNLSATLESGQVFGFTKQADNSYLGNICNYPVRLAQQSSVLCIKLGTVPSNSKRSIELQMVRPHIVKYFDLDFDLKFVYEILKSDPVLLPVYDHLKGLRIIRQDPWEALACFIISSNNNVKRIQGIYRNLTARLGEGGAFPKPAAIARVHERTLRELGLGYRAPFLQKTAQFVSANPQTLDAIREAPYEEAVQRVIAFPGIGPKVADCVLLYGFHKLEAFPVDVWMYRVMKKLYFPKRRPSEKQVQMFGQKRWGSMAGYVQQYLFHAVRMGKV